MKTTRILFCSALLLASSMMNAQIAMVDSGIKPSKETSTSLKKSDTPPSIVKEGEVVYISPEDRIYVNKNLPIYLKFSTSPNGKTYDLKSLKHPEDTEPFYLDTEGPNYIRTKWALDPETKKYAYPLREIEMELYADSKPPVVSPVFKSSSSYNRGGTVYYGRDLGIDFKHWDEQAGVKGSYWSLNNNSWEEGMADFSSKNSGSYTFTYYSVDNVNNYTDSKTVSFVYDKTAPNTKLIPTRDDLYVFGPKTFVQFEIVEEHAGVKDTYYRLTGVDFTKVRKGQVLPANLEDGEYKLDYYSIDNVNNGESSKSQKVYLDKIAPESLLNASPSFEKGDRLYVSPKSEIRLSATDNKAGVRDISFTTRGFKNATYTEPVTLNGFHGLTSINYSAVDMVDNKEANNYQEIFVDSLRPATDIEFLGDFFEVASRFYVNEATKIKLSASDLNSGVARTEYAGIGNDFNKYEEPFSLTKEGYYGMMYRSIDNVDNVEYSQSIDLYLDKKGPEIVFNFSNRSMGEEDGVKIYPVGTRLFLGATDDQSGTNTISYQVNNQKAVHYSSPKTIDISEKKAFKKGKVYEVQIMTTDLVNNETEQTIKFRIEG